MPRHRAFTLVELLVVISIIVILLALILAGLDQAMIYAQRGRCGSNLDAAGTAVVMCVTDSESRRFPKTVAEFALFGKLGTAGGYEFVNVTARPANKYLGFTNDNAEVPVARCPADAGRQGDDKEVYTLHGNSYVAAHRTSNRSGIASVFGSDPPMGMQELTSPSAKILAGDGPMYGDVKWADKPNRWHSRDKAKRQMNVLFADAHVEFFEFKNHRVNPDGIEAESGGPNTRRGWW